MKRVFAWFFAGYFMVGSISPHTDFAQLWHFASAWQHFKLHQLEAATHGQLFSIWSFVRDHYVNPDSHEHNGTFDHDQLPVHHLHPGLDLIVQSTILPHSIIPDFYSRESIAFVDYGYSFLFKPGIDRPPSLS